MILPEECESPIQSAEMDNMDIGEALSDLIVDAKSQDRLTCGVASSVKLLEMNADVVLMCILPVDPNQPVTVGIQQTLIEAFCWEYGICLVKVDSTEKLSTLVKTDDTNGNEQDYKDYCCVLVQFPSPNSKHSKSYQLIDQYCHSLYMNCNSNQPIVELPS